jgi:multiple sugar transport system permease protein
VNPEGRAGKELVLVYFGLSLWVLIMVLPFLWIVSTSLKSNAEVYMFPPKLWPETLRFDAFVRVFHDYAFGSHFLNSMIIAVGATSLSLVVGLLAGYSIARLGFPGDRIFLTFLLGSLMLPAVVIVIPLFRVLQSLNLIDTYAGLILVNCSATLPLVVWMMQGFFSSIPRELEEAARIDGCSYFGAFVQVVLPLSAPGIAACAIFIFLIVWNEFLFSLIFTARKAKTLTVVISEFIGIFEISWNQLAAAAVITTLPVLAFVLFFQKGLISGLTKGAVKG